MNKVSMAKVAISAVAACAMVVPLAACGSSSAGGDADGKVTLKFAAFEGGYGAQMYKDVVAAYEKLNPDVKIELTTSKKIADEITPGMKAGNYPDIVELGQGTESGLTETMLKDKALEDVTDVLDMTVPGESKTVKDKLVDGIIGLYTNPYGDDQTYLMPMYYSPSGLVYNKTLLEQNGWEVPTTWDEFFKLGDEAKAKGISLFTYPTAGYFDAFFNALLADIGGDDFYTDVMTYKKDVWKSKDATEALTLVQKLVTEYLNPDTVGYANSQDFTKNQQSVLDGKSLFMPNGTWIVNEMKDAPRTDGFEWGFAPVPTTTEGGTRYINTTIEGVWIPKKAKHIEEAKKFMAFLYSDTAADIFNKTGAVQPIKGMTDKVDDTMKVFYDAYNQDGVKAVAGSFSTTASVEGKNIKDDLYTAVDSVASGKKSLADWQKALNDTSNALNEASSK
ncbi:carbohydrate ABC transporter substrate-binding protein [Bifidobacterium goeldii]|uniref:Carbohydrate ABC transporter substrate-binding protein n=1 Tax=Bifidobacterium goeldii TaxID=2306975 RepID=A0A430FKL9_9BIFI|nr:carbohydrate ABC transporter substrate-binding protein [Bifidobacterium goeldii]RSX53302.1 carbohydrate ABC transporter substrate-binding protein [Bifidobacterium goeldii]